MTVWNVELYSYTTDEVEAVLCSCEDEDWARTIARALRPSVYEGYEAIPVPASIPTV